MFRRLTRRLHWLFRRRQVEADMAEEMRFHLDMRTEDTIADGLSLDAAHFAAVRTQSNSPLIESSLRQAVSAVDPKLPIFMVSTQEERLDGLLLKEKMFAHVAAYLGVVALGLAYVGLYGLISYTVLRRTGEIGVRMALGAFQRNILSMILRGSLSIVLVGLLIGFPAACAATQLISSMLFGLSSNDLFTYSIVAVFVVCIALIACGLPARRAANVDPIAALRAE